VDESAWLTIARYLAPAVIGCNLDSARDCAALFSKVRGHRMAKAALENALWDAEAKQKTSRCGSCWAAREPKSLAESRSAFRIRRAINR
jgi:hypothetical protein